MSRSNRLTMRLNKISLANINVSMPWEYPEVLSSIYGKSDNIIYTGLSGALFVWIHTLCQMKLIIKLYPDSRSTTTREKNYSRSRSLLIMIILLQEV